MKRGISRKINVQKYGGNQYESVDFWIEDEEKDFVELKVELDGAITDFIGKVPEEQAKFEKAKENQPPFVD